MRVLFLSCLIFCQSAMAKDWSQYKEKLESRTEGFLSQRIQKRLVRAQKFMARENYQRAFKLLEKIVSNKNLDSFAKAKVWYHLAFAYAQKEKYDKARKAFEKVLALDVLPYNPTLQSLFSLAQFMALENDLNGAEKKMEQWFALSNEPHPPAYIFMANIMYQKKKTSKALELVLKGISLTSKPQESWLAFAVSLLYMQKKYREASVYLYKLIETKINKKTYWKQLAASLLSSDQSFHALAVLKLAMMVDLLNEEGEVLNVVNLYLAHGMPFEASQVMGEGLKQKIIKSNRKNFELYTNALIHAKEYSAAMEPLEQAAQMSSDGKLYALRARLLLEQGKYKPALADFDKSIKKGLKAKQLGRVLLEKGITLIQMGRLEKAASIIKKAVAYKSVTSSALNWQKYLQSL